MTSTSQRGARALNRPLSLFVAKVCHRNENERDSTDSGRGYVPVLVRILAALGSDFWSSFPSAFFFEEFEVSEHVSHRNCFLGCCRSRLVVALGHNPRRAECLPFVFEGKGDQGKLLGQVIWTREVYFESARTQLKRGWPCLAA